METRKEIIKQMGDAMREDIFLEVNNRIERSLRRRFWLRISAVAASVTLLVQHLQLYLFPRRLQETEQPNGRDGESDGNAILRSPV